MGSAALLYDFGPFRLDGKRRIVVSRADGQVLPLTTKAFDTLLHLVEHAGEVVDRATLLREIWPNVVVEANNLNQVISSLRRAIGEDPAAHRFIMTVPGRGYRFIADVDNVAADGPGEEAARGAGTARQAGAQRERSLAVLPFRPLVAADRHESLELGMADALIASIGGLRDVQVRPLSATRRYGRLEQDPVEAGRSLGVDYVLDGSLQRSDSHLRVSVRLIDVQSRRQLWSDHFDEDFTDIFSIQDRIAERVASSLVDTLTSGERDRLRRHPTQDAHAYQLYVTAWSSLTRPSCSSMTEALRYLEQAVARDPSFALAHACLADCYAVLAVFGGGAPHDIFPQALAAVTKALAIDPELAEAHAELGHIRMVYNLDLDGAEEAFRRALGIDPNSAMAHHYMGLLLIARGTLDDALASVRRAQALAPLALNFNANVGMIHYYARRYEQAVAQLETTLAMDPASDHARSLLGRALLRLGEFERAILEFERRRSVTIGSAADLPAACALAGREDDARAQLEKMKQAAQDRYVSPFDVATVHAALGDTEETLHWLEQALEQRAQPVNFLCVDPAFDAFRQEPRFERMLASLNPRPR
ncbi:MAG TPA: winged helix-turn-helix domain-containing protein [Woeseiaceae bacterium]|nr:winged helix-turn-helix domain-containing protein [Woeseiaceae bacterium]